MFPRFSRVQPRHEAKRAYFAEPMPSPDRPMGLRLWEISVTSVIKICLVLNYCKKKKNYSFKDKGCSFRYEF